MARILLIDDDEPLRKMLRITLVQMGHTVIEAANGLGAVEIQAKHAIDVVLTDLIMPEKEGLETIIELRRHHCRAKIVAMSGGGRANADSYLALASKLGAIAVLQKPFSNDEMTAAITMATGVDSLPPSAGRAT